MNIIDKALQFATKAHSGQTRWDGKTAYITHPIEVSKIAMDIYWDYFMGRSCLDDVIIVSYLHDSLEDTEVTYNQLVTEFGEEVAKAVLTLSKVEGESYLDFVLRAKNNMMARVVKIADITHNLSDLKKGSMRDKYLLAKYILEN